MKENEYLKSYVEVEEANGSLFSKFILFLDPSHLNNTQTLWLGWQGLHTQRLKAVLKVIKIERVDNNSEGWKHTKTIVSLKCKN